MCVFFCLYLPFHKVTYEVLLTETVVWPIIFLIIPKENGVLGGTVFTLTVRFPFVRYVFYFSLEQTLWHKKQATENHIRTIALERSVMNYWVLKSIWWHQPRPQCLKCFFCTKKKICKIRRENIKHLHQNMEQRSQKAGWAAIEVSWSQC